MEKGKIGGTEIETTKIGTTEIGTTEITKLEKSSVTSSQASIITSNSMFLNRWKRKRFDMLDHRHSWCFTIDSFIQQRHIDVLNRLRQEEYVLRHDFQQMSNKIQQWIISKIVFDNEQLSTNDDKAQCQYNHVLARRHLLLVLNQAEQCRSNEKLAENFIRCRAVNHYWMWYHKTRAKSLKRQQDQLEKIRLKETKLEEIRLEKDKLRHTGMMMDMTQRYCWSWLKNRTP